MQKHDNRSEARAYIYTWFSEKFIAFAEQQLPDDWETETLAEAFDYIGLPQLGALATEMASQINQTPAFSEAIIKEHFRLFFGGQEEPIPLFGSWWIDGGFDGPSTQMVFEVYEQHELTPHEDIQWLPDHISIELEFLYSLAVREEQAREAGEIATALANATAQLEFLRQFVYPWVSPLCQRAVQQTQEEFFRLFCQLLQGMVTEDQVVLSDIINDYQQPQP